VSARPSRRGEEDRSKSGRTQGEESFGQLKKGWGAFEICRKKKKRTLETIIWQWGPRSKGSGPLRTPDTHRRGAKKNRGKRKKGIIRMCIWGKLSRAERKKILKPSCESLKSDGASEPPEVATEVLSTYSDNKGEAYERPRGTTRHEEITE